MASSTACLPVSLAASGVYSVCGWLINASCLLLDYLACSLMGPYG